MTGRWYLTEFSIAPISVFFFVVHLLSTHSCSPSLHFKSHFVLIFFFCAFNPGWEPYQSDGVCTQITNALLCFVVSPSHSPLVSPLVLAFFFLAYHLFLKMCARETYSPHNFFLRGSSPVHHPVMLGTLSRAGCCISSQTFFFCVKVSCKTKVPHFLSLSIAYTMVCSQSESD